jgi:hypothetical protein
MRPSPRRNASAPGYLTPTKPGCWNSTSSPDGPPPSPPVATSSSKRRTHLRSAAPSSQPRTGYAAGSPALPSASPPRWTTSTSKAASDYYDFVVEKVRVTGWRVEIYLKIPLADEPPDDDRPNDKPPDDDPDQPGPEPAEPLSSDIRLRSVRGHRHRILAVSPRTRTPTRQTSMTPVAKPRTRVSPLRPSPYGLGPSRRHPRPGIRPSDQAPSTRHDQRREVGPLQASVVGPLQTAAPSYRPGPARTSRQASNKRSS